MYICICNAITEGDVRSAEQAGAVKEREVFRHFGVKAQCCRCLPSMRGMLKAEGKTGDRRHLSDGHPAPVARAHDKR